MKKDDLEDLTFSSKITLSLPAHWWNTSRDGKWKVSEFIEKSFTITKELKKEIFDACGEYKMWENELPQLVLVPFSKVKKYFRLPRFLWGFTLRMFDIDIVFVPHLRKIVPITYTPWSIRKDELERMKHEKS